MALVERYFVAGIEACSPCDNASELATRTNDEGWDTVFDAWLRSRSMLPHGSSLTASCELRRGSA